MRINLVRFRSVPVAAALIAAASFLVPSVATAGDSYQVAYRHGDEKVVTTELRDLRAKLVRLNADTDRLESFTNGPRLSWQTHSAQLEEIKSHVNSIGEQLASLERMRPIAVEWQQEAIERVVPVAVQLAERTTAAINHLNENQTRLWAPEYVSHLREMSALADHMHGTVSNYLKIIDAQNEIDHLDGTLRERVS